MASRVFIARRRRQLRQRTRAVFRAYLSRARSLAKRMMDLGPVAPKTVADKMQTRAIKGGRAQWKRWYRANRQYQRRIAALKQLGVKCNPQLAGLRRAIVP